MDEYEQQERQRAMEEKIKYFDEMEQAAKIKQARDAISYQQKVTDKTFKKALAKHGLTEQTWAKIISENPDAVMDSFKTHIKSYVKTVAKTSGRRAEPKGRLSEPARGKPATQRRGSNFEELKEKASRGHVSDDELIEHLTTLLR